MKKNFRIMVTSLVLALSIMVTIIPVQAAQLTPTVSKNSCHEWNLKLYFDGSIYEKQTGQIRISNGFYGTELKFKSSNTKIAIVDKYGNVTGKKAGKVTITVTDGTHTAKCKVTIKALSKAKKNEVVLNLKSEDTICEGAELEYGKTYTIKSLNGSSVKKIRSFNGGCKVNGAKVTALPKDDRSTIVLKVYLRDGRSSVVSFRSTSSKEREEAIAIAKEGMKEYGVTTESSDLEKAMFIYNWNGDKIDELWAGHPEYENPGHYYGIRKGAGDCDVHAEAVSLLADVVGIPVIEISNDAVGRDHRFNGIKVDGEWYLMDTMQCESWRFSYNDEVHFLNSYAREVELDHGMAFMVNPNAAKDITFTSTKYDGVIWPEYRDKYDEANPFEEWDW